MSATIDRMLAQARAKARGEHVKAPVQRENLYVDSRIGKMTCYVPDPDAPDILPQYSGRRPRLFDF